MLAVLVSCITVRADQAVRSADKYANSDALVADTHQASRRARGRVLRQTIARKSSWPHGAWGETLWALAALHLPIA